MKRTFLIISLVTLAMHDAEPAGAATPRGGPRHHAKARAVPKCAAAITLAAALLATPTLSMATPATFANQAQQLHPVAATVAHHLARQLETLQRMGWTVAYHDAANMPSLAARAPDQRSAAPSAAERQAVSEIEKLAGMRAREGLAHVAIHFTEKGVLSINAASGAAPVYWRTMVPKAAGVYDLLGTTGSQGAPHVNSAWHAQLTPWGIHATPVPTPTDLSSLMP